MSCSGHKLTYGKVVHCNGCPERWGTKVQAALAASQAEVRALKADMLVLARKLLAPIPVQGTEDGK